jgi:hypothetical protein
MRGNYLGTGIGSFFFHKIAKDESGYNYYGYMHISGQSVILRETIATGIAEYADAGHRLANWDNRATLTYTDIFTVSYPIK